MLRQERDFRKSDGVLREGVVVRHACIARHRTIRCDSCAGCSRSRLRAFKRLRACRACPEPAALRGADDSRGAAGHRDSLRAAPRGATDATGRPAREAGADVRRDDAVRASASGGAESPPAPVRPGGVAGARSRLGRRHHVYPRARGLDLLGRAAGSGVAPRGRLGVRRDARPRSSVGRAAHAARASSPTAWRPASF